MVITKELLDKTKLLKAKLDELGREINNPQPAFINRGPRPLTITEQIQRLMRVELSRQASAQGYESFEESDDFEDDEVDDAPLSTYQDEKLMRPDWPGPQERAELAKKADLADLDMESSERTEVQDPPPENASPGSLGNPGKASPKPARRAK